ncbi:MAG: hypothetical protein HYY28_00705 [Betaproteobacteria bacterium]|nr:hypothetical protein [Betaproteobacteria bacterium]
MIRIGALSLGALILSLSASPALVHAMGGAMGASGGMGQSAAMSQGGQMSQSGMMGANGGAGMMGASGGMGQVGVAGQRLFRPGWNLAGNTGTAAIDVAATFGTPAAPVTGVTANVLTVWKWDAAAAQWLFYAPSLEAAALADYAASKGYGVLASIEPGEGYWLNAVAGFSIGGDPFGSPPAPAAGPSGGDAFVLTRANMMRGWNLVATGMAMHPRQLKADFDSTPPAAGEATQNFQSLWAWDSEANRWYFYAPSLDTGGSEMMNYIRSQGYLDFSSMNKRLGAGVGFWVNMP